MSASHNAERDERRLIALLAEVNRARARFRAGRNLTNSASRHEQQQRSAQLAAAMEAYAEAAENCGVPLSYKYRNEMLLHRLMVERRPDPQSTR